MNNYIICNKNVNKTTKKKKRLHKKYSLHTKKYLYNSKKRMDLFENIIFSMYKY